MATGDTVGAGKLEMLHCVIELHPSQVHVHGCISQIQNKDEQHAQDVNTAFKSVTLEAPSLNTPQFLSPVLKICPIICLHCMNNLKITFLFSKKDVQYKLIIQPELTGYHNVIGVDCRHLTSAARGFRSDAQHHNSIGTTGHRSKGLSAGERHGFQRL